MLEWRAQCEEMLKMGDVRSVDAGGTAAEAVDHCGNGVSDRRIKSRKGVQKKRRNGTED